MFQPGDLIVYGTTGVCRVEALDRPGLSSADKKRLYYRLKPLQQDGLIYTPAEDGKVPMRPVISREAAEALIDCIPTIRAEPRHDTTIQSLAQHYQAAVHSSDCRDLLELMMSIYAKRRQAESQKRRLGMVDEQYAKQAKRLLHGELSAALEIPFDDVEAYIASRMHEKKEEA